MPDRKPENGKVNGKGDKEQNAGSPEKPITIKPPQYIYVNKVEKCSDLAKIKENEIIKEKE